MAFPPSGGVLPCHTLRIHQDRVPSPRRAVRVPLWRFGAIDPESYLAFMLEPFQADYFLLRRCCCTTVADQKTNPSECLRLCWTTAQTFLRMMTSSTSIGELNVLPRRNTTPDLCPAYIFVIIYLSVLSFFPLKTTVLRINRFIAILVDETGEYESNGQSTTSDLSQINVRTDLYVGGIPATVANSFISSSVNMTSFVALDIFDGGVRVVANYGTAQPTVVRATGLVGYGICDGKAHTVSLRITETSVQISIDGGTMDETTIAERQTTNIQGPMFIGGIQDDRKSELTTGIITASLQGCISSLILNGQGQDLTAGFSKSGVRRGCPLAIP
ncbi:putative laminin-like protein epi-1 [Apostichopus japonicus]|uniref:Putative laminin-like protein epi-1 n=1 Tax=Stichopus japonicus TaxID=307972 RepID=A0A2G8KV12_STIJA|nr:putative laminin-like protein epi-1 [Apostichopus japonicus]